MRSVAAMPDRPATSRDPSPSEAGRPELSVLIPFYREDPLPLVAMLAAQCAVPGIEVEIVLFDDGSQDAGLNRRIEEEIARGAMPARLVVSQNNRGRAATRNALSAAARAPWLLFLDADMRVPDGFLARYIEAARKANFDAAFGGYETGDTANEDVALHVAFAKASDVRDAAQRAAIGATAFCSSNLLVRTELMQGISFDPGYVGWGWEDVDWAVSAARKHKLVHLDIPAVHDGWQTGEELLDKFRQAATNYTRLLTKHPDLARLPGGQAVRLLYKLPAQGLLRPLWAGFVRTRAAPMRLRVLALKLWRASWAAEETKR